MEVILLGNPDENPSEKNTSSIPIPEYIPPDGAVLLENIEIPVQQTTSTTSITSGDKYYVHSQSVASDTWLVKHNLSKRPSIHVEDASGNEMIAQIIHINNNFAQIVFGRPYSGSAHCN